MIEYTNRPTPNRSLRGDVKAAAIVLHHTGGREAGDLAWLTNPTSGVSADFLINRDGVIYKLNPDLTIYYTYHAGISELDGCVQRNGSINISTIGIEMSHTIDQDWPDAQVEACAKLCWWLEASGKVTRHKIVSHREVAKPSGRKIDPKGFPWGVFSQLYEAAGFLQSRTDQDQK